MSAYHSFNLDSSRASASLFPTRNILDRKVTELAPLECMEINSGIDNTGQEKNGSNSEHDGGGDDDDDDNCFTLYLRLATFRTLLATVDYDEESNRSAAC